LVRAEVCVVVEKDEEALQEVISENVITGIPMADEVKKGAIEKS
jgi:hypothetical protein